MCDENKAFPCGVGRNCVILQAERIQHKVMTAIELRAELFREMNPLLDNETAMMRLLAFVRSLVSTKKSMAEKKNEEKSYEVLSLSPDIKKWSGSASFSEEEIESDPRLKALLFSCSVCSDAKRE